MLCVMGLNKNYPPAIAFSPKEYFGAEIPHLKDICSTGKIKMYMGNLCKSERTSKLMAIVKDHTELQIGEGKCQL